jgi:flagellar protein FlbT
MPLKLKLRPNERVVVNGCVIRNEDRQTTLTVDNFAQILREKDILQPEQATTPGRAAYVRVQLLLLGEGDAVLLQKEAAAALQRLHGAFADEARHRVLEAANALARRDFYKALAALREVFAHEDRVLGRSAA